jgi:hypothetical protein
LADDGSIDKHDNALAYVETEANSPANGQFTAAWATDGRTATVAGPCPACGGFTATEFSHGICGSKGFRGVFRARAPRPQGLPSPLTLFCECGHAHTDRPPDALDKGCGRFWPVFLPEDARLPPPASAASTPDTPETPDIPATP